MRQLAAAAGDIPIGMLTSIIPNALIDRWKKENAPTTAYQRRLALRRFLRWLEKMGGPRDLVGELRKMRCPGAREVIATEEERTRLYGAAAPWLRAWLYLTNVLAFRFSEALSAAPANYNPEAGTITLRTKGAQQHTLPVPDELAELFELAPTTEDTTTPYLELLRGRPVSKWDVRHAWRALKTKCQVNPDLRPHDLRRTSAVTLYEATKDLHLVQQLLGHSSMHSTVHYLAHRDPNKLRPLLQLLKPQTEVKQ